MIFNNNINYAVFFYIIVVIFILSVKPKILDLKKSKNPINRALVVYLMVVYAIASFYVSVFIHLKK
tara:strand:- start:217 stop:414 length:198 start_codon:yes stop_codon:yes gene_type:complete